MKQFLFLILTSILIVSCNTDEDNNPKFRLDLLPIESAVIPAQFKKDSLYKLPFKYKRPSNCHSFSGFYYERNANIRIIAIESSVLEQDNCQTIDEATREEILEFKPTLTGSYIFKLWKGKDASNIDIYEEIEIPVIL